MNEINKDRIQELFYKLNEKFKRDDARGELIVYGGATLCLYMPERKNTKDIDAIFYPKDLFHKYIEEIATEESLDSNWLNDGVKGFVSHNNDVVEYLSLSHLRVTTVSPKYLLAMKVMAARTYENDSKDINDIKLLIQKLNLKSADEVFDIVLKYYGEKELLPKSQYLVEEIFYNKKDI